jgi:hypothetical protein
MIEIDLIRPVQNAYSRSTPSNPRGNSDCCIRKKRARSPREAGLFTDASADCERWTKAMTLKHSSLVTFEIAFNGEPHGCSFFITDGRLLTVSASGLRQTRELGATPPLALAESMAADLLGHRSAPATPPTHKNGPIETAMAWLAKSSHHGGCGAAAAD